MDRVWEANASGTAPTLPGGLQTGYPTETPVPTVPGAWWYYQVTEEIRNVIAQGTTGLTPDSSSVNQLQTAINTLITKSAIKPTFSNGTDASTATGIVATLTRTAAGGSGGTGMAGSLQYQLQDFSGSLIWTNSIRSQWVNSTTGVRSANLIITSALGASQTDSVSVNSDGTVSLVAGASSAVNVVNQLLQLTQTSGSAYSGNGTSVALGSMTNNNGNQVVGAIGSYLVSGGTGGAATNHSGGLNLYYKPTASTTPVIGVQLDATGNLTMLNAATPNLYIRGNQTTGSYVSGLVFQNNSGATTGSIQSQYVGGTNIGLIYNTPTGWSQQWQINSVGAMTLSSTGLSVTGGLSTTTAVTIGGGITASGNISTANGSGPINLTVSGLGSGTNGGSAILAQASGTTSAAIGNYSNLIGGTYDATPTLYGNGSLRVYTGGISAQFTSSGLNVYGGLTSTSGITNTQSVNTNSNLTLTGSGAYSSIISLGGGGAGAGAIYTTATVPLLLGTNTTIQVTIDTSGRVQIATNNSTSASAKLVVGSGLASTNGLIVANTSNGSYSGLTISNWTGATTSVGPYQVFDNSGFGTWYVGSGNGANTFDIATTWGTPLLRLDSYGNLLVGTTTTTPGNAAGMVYSLTSQVLNLFQSSSDAGTWYQSFNYNGSNAGYIGRNGANGLAIAAIGSLDLSGASVTIGGNVPITSANIGSQNVSYSSTSGYCTNGITQATNLPNGTTATTQSASTNNTELATTAYVNTAIQNANVYGLSEQISGNTLILGFSGGYVTFLNTNTNGTPGTYYIPATTITIPAGATLGCLGGFTTRIFICAFANGGYPVIGVSAGLSNDESSSVNTVAINGSSNASKTFYTNSAISTGTFWRLLGHADVLITTAGTWSNIVILKQVGYGSSLTFASNANLRTLLTGASIGHGSGTTYTNSSGRDIWVLIGKSQAGTGGYAYAYVDGNLVGWIISDSTNGGSTGSFTFPVPNGSTYLVSSSSGLNTWYEYR